MSRIFALMTLSIALIAGGGAVSVAYQNSGASSQQLDAIAGLFATGIEISVILPVVLGIGLAIGTLGVLARA